MRLSAFVYAAGFAFVVAPQALACACGCGVFEVSGLTLLPTGERATVFVDYDFLDQNRNWSGSGAAPAANNDDKRITTNFVTFGGQVRLDDQWTAMVEIPVWDRFFKTDTGTAVENYRHTALGDIRLTSFYTPYSGAGSATGLILGVKLPTGDYGFAPFDRDVSIGTGSTDALIGVYHTGGLTEDGTVSWSGRLIWQKPVVTTASYKPGSEADAALGVHYSRWTAGDWQITPILQSILATRARDHGRDGDPDNTGYTRILLSPGITVTNGHWSFSADVGIALYQYVNGNQLVGHEQFKAMLSYTL